MKNRSRHPKIHYWFWTENTLKNNEHRRILDTVAENSDFDTVAITSQGPGFLDLWDTSYKDKLADAADYAHKLGIKLYLQLFPKGFAFENSSVTVNDAASIAVEHEGVLDKNKKLVFTSVENWARMRKTSPAIGTELIFAVAFKKTADGFYEENSVVDVIKYAEITEKTPETLTFSFDIPSLDGYTVYALAAHYYKVADLFSDTAVGDYKEMMDNYADVHFDGFVVDEFKNMPILPPWQMDCFRGRIYGKSFDKYFYEHTGTDLKRTMFDMRYCPDGKDEIRIAAINRYFDTFRKSTVIVETAIAEYSRKTFGKNSFAGLHNTFHNDLDGDEIWTTCCNWWEVPRTYAQTDEDIAFPVRLGIACGCKENLIYDMYYTNEKEKFFVKCMKDAAFGGRIHYHSAGSDCFGINIGTKEFLGELKKYEDNVDLLNLFDPAMPDMSLLIVFGFPALYNWYPDHSARNAYDINGSLGILKKADKLWRSGVINALSTDDAIADGRITLDENNKFDYCNNKFDAMLYLYPQYSKSKTLGFLKHCAESGANIRVIGKIGRDFEGAPVDAKALERCTVSEDCDIVKEMGLRINDIPNGCRLADGSVVMSCYESVRYSKPQEAEFTINGKKYEVSYEGVFAMKTGRDGKIERLVSGKLDSLKENGRDILPEYRGCSVMYGIKQD